MKSKVTSEVREILPYIDTLLTERLRGTRAATLSLLGALFIDAKSDLQGCLVEASSKLENLEEAEKNVENVLTKMFTDDDSYAVYLFCAIVLVLCFFIFIKLYRFDRIDFTKLDEYSNWSYTSDRKVLNPPPAMNFSAI